MSEQFIGKVEILKDASTTTIMLDGREEED